MLRAFADFAAFVACSAALIAAPASAQNVCRTVTTITTHADGSVETVVEEWAEHSPAMAQRLLPPASAESARLAFVQYGPFRVLDAQTIALIGATDSRSPAQFAALLADFPDIAMLEFIEAPGTQDDRANLQLARAIRAHGLATRVAAGGSVRSGAVELFLAGVTREIADGSEFAVHAWLDDWGRGAEDYPSGAAEHRRYLDFYVEMGMNDQQAAQFYAMTNSVPFEQARWLSGVEMRKWMRAGGEKPDREDLAYLDSSVLLP